MRLVIIWLLFLLILWQTNAVTHTQEQIEQLEEWYNDPIPYYIHWDSYTNSLVAYARAISQDFDFVLTIRAESGFRPWAEWDNGHAFWVCQRNDLHWRNRLIDDPNFQDAKRQIDQCWRSYQIRYERGIIGNRLYGYNVRNKYKNEFVRK